jgi:hypothetical protein
MRQRKVRQRTVPTWLHSVEWQLGDDLNVLADRSARRATRSTAQRLEPCGLARQGRQRSKHTELSGARRHDGKLEAA